MDSDGSRWRTLASAAALWLVLAPPTAAQTRADPAVTAARELGVQGVTLYGKNQYADAEAKLDQAYRAYPVPTLGLWSARARTKLGQLARAADRYRDAVAANIGVGEERLQKQAQADAATELAALLPRIPTITIELRGVSDSQVVLTLDGVTIADGPRTGRPVDPGHHELTAAHGGERRALTFDVSEGELEKPLVLEFESAAPLVAAVAPPAPASQPVTPIWRPLAISALAIGGAGLITSAVTTGIALAQCPSGDCAADKLDSYRTLRTVATASFYVGAAFAVAGLVPILLGATHSRAPTSERISWSIGPGSAALSGRF